jgi:hypothetical protein
MRPTARRIRDGQALKDAIDAYPGGMTLTALAARTAELDPAGTGVSFQLIGLLRTPASAGMSGSGPGRTRRYRTSTSPATADLIEQALNCRPGELFNREEIPEPGDTQAVPEARFRAAG